MPRSVNQKRLQTSQGQGKIVCKHDLILIQSRLNEDKPDLIGRTPISEERGDPQRRQRRSHAAGGETAGAGYMLPAFCAFRAAER